MNQTPINLTQKLSLFSEQWSPKIVAQMNDYHFKLSKLEGEFVWHAHEETDEMFLVLEGEMQLEFRDGELTLKEGEMFVVPKGVEHKPFAKEECCVLVCESAGTFHTGNAKDSGIVESSGEWL